MVNVTTPSTRIVIELTEEEKKACLERKKESGAKTWKDLLLNVTPNMNVTELTNNLESQRLTWNEFKKLCKENNQPLEYLTNATQQDIELKDTKKIDRRIEKKISGVLKTLNNMTPQEFIKFMTPIIDARIKEKEDKENRLLDEMTREKKELKE